MAFGQAAATAAVVAIDLHRGHLDPAVATVPVPPGVEKTVIANNAVFLDRARAAGIPVVHLLTVWRDVEEIAANPLWRVMADDPKRSRRNIMRHNLIGSPGTEIMPEVLDESDWVVDTKKRYNCFEATDLDFLLRKHGIDTLFLTGVNTNSCVLSTAVAACSKDYGVVVVSDCVDTADGPELHTAALRCVETAFGWVMTGEEALAELTAEGGAVAAGAGA